MPMVINMLPVEEGDPLKMLADLARKAGVPMPPPITLPALPSLGGCDMNALAAGLGQAVADELTSQLTSLPVKSLLTGDLSDAKEMLLDYLGQLDSQKSSLLQQLVDGSGVRDVLGASQDVLGGVRAALGQATGAPLVGGVLSAVSAACPAAGGLLGYSEDLLDSLSGQLSAADSFISGLQNKVDSITSLEQATEALLGEVESRIGGLPGLFSALGGST